MKKIIKTIILNSNLKLMLFSIVGITSVYAATYTITIRQLADPSMSWRNGVVMNSSNKIQNVIAIDDNTFEPPTTNASNDYLENEILSTHSSTAIAVGWNYASFSQGLLDRGDVFSVLSRDDMTAEVEGGIRFFSAYTIPSAAYYSMSTSGVMKTTSPITISASTISFLCNKVNPAYHIPDFSITTPNLDDSLKLSGTVLSAPDSNANTNTLDDSAIRIRWRNLTAGFSWQTDNPNCADGVWNFSLTESDFNSEVSNQFEAYAYAVSERNFLPMSDYGNTVWLQKPTAAQDPYIAVTAPADFTIYDFATNITITGVATDDVSVASVKISNVDVDGFSGPGQNCTWDNQVSLVEGTNSFTFTATDDELLTDSVTVRYIVKGAAPQPDHPFLMVTNPANWSVFTSAQMIDITGIATDNVAIVSLTRNGTEIIGSYTNPGFIDSQFIGLGTNTYIYIARDGDGNAATDTVNYVVSDGSENPPYIEVLSPASLSIYPVPTNITVAGIATDNFSVVTITRNGADIGIISGDNISWTNIIFKTLLPKGTNYFTYIATDNDGNTATDTVRYIILSDGNVDTNPYERVLSTWPRYIGSSQTGSVEFLSKYACNYFIDAEISTGVYKTVAQGSCLAGWNLVPFAGTNLPYQVGSGVSNVLSLRLNYTTKSITNQAHIVTVVEDLKFDLHNPKLFTEDFDGDAIFIKYKSKAGSKLTTKGRTIFIKGGSPLDKLMIKVKPNKDKSKLGDGTARICGVISDSGLKMIKTFTSIDMIQADENVGKVILKGSLGFISDTWRYNVRFPAPVLKSKTKIMTKIVKSKKTKQFMAETGNIYANILIGKLKDDVNSGVLESDPYTLSDTEELGGIVMLAAKGGNVGVDKATAENYNIKYTKRRLTAGHIKTVMAKPKKIVGGKIVDYSFYLDNEYKPAKLLSNVKMLASNFVDSSGGNSNMFFVFGYDSDAIKSPSTITNWVGQNVKYNFKKIIIKSGSLKGTIVTKGPVDKAKQIKKIDEASWIIDGELE